jgi:hypothetical protein
MAKSHGQDGNSEHGQDHDHDHGHEHGPGAHGHHHGDPFVWDPDEEDLARSRKQGRKLIAWGLAALAVGALFFWWASTYA